MFQDHFILSPADLELAFFFSNKEECLEIVASSLSI
jgi:hypothetical protein